MQYVCILYIQILCTLNTVQQVKREQDNKYKNENENNLKNKIEK